jgi:ABC-2 type transport system permease protein
MRKYWSIFKIQVINSLAYPGELVGRSLIIIPFLWIFFQLWTVTFRAAGVDSINGMTLQDTLWYLMIAETVELGKPRIARTVAENVRDGSIAYLLNKPYNFLLYQFSTSMGDTVFRTLTNALVGGTVTWLLVGPVPHLANLPVVLLAVLGSWVLNFCMNGLIGLAAFIAEDVAPFEWIYQKLAFIFGGLLIPLDFYPGWLQTISRLLPFSSMVYAPARLFVAPDASGFVSLIGIQVIWIIAFILMLSLAFRRGLKFITVNGG